MAEATPGPWLLSGETIYALDETGGCNRFSCQVQGGYSYHGRTVKERTSDEEVAANARVIASALDLYKALSEIMNRHASNVMFGDRALAEEAWAALAKAEGRHP